MSNFAQDTNFSFGMSIIDDYIYTVQSVVLPGFSFNTPEIGGSGGARAIIAADSIVYDVCSLNILVDEKLEVYKTLIKHLIDRINPTSGSFSNVEFTAWVSIKDSLGVEKLKLEYYGCRLENIGGLDLNSSSDDVELLLPISFKFDEFALIDGVDIPTLQI